MDTAPLCFRLAAVDGTSGDEAPAAKDVQALFSKFMKTETDTLGNVRGTLGNGPFRILLDAHIDRVGLVVRGIDEKGFLLIDMEDGGFAVIAMEEGCLIMELSGVEMILEKQAEETEGETPAA